MSCEEIRSKLDAWTDGDLDAASHVAVQRHLDGCPACREALMERDPLRMFAGLAAEAPPAEAWDGFWEGIRDGIRRDDLAARRRRPVAWRMAAGVAAALIILVAAFILMGRPARKDPGLPMVAVAGVPALAGSPRPQTVEQVRTPGSRPVQIFSMAYEPGAGADVPTELVLIVDAGLEL